MKKKVLSVVSAFLLALMLVPMLALGISADEANPEAYEHYVPATDEAMTIDGIKEASYDKGVIFYSSLTDGTDEYKNSGTMASFTAWYVWDGKGKVYCFVEVIDSEIVVNSDLWAYKWWHCGSWQMYIDYGYTKSSNTQWTFVGDESGEYTKTAPESYKVVLSDRGFVVEYCFDFLGMDFIVGDKFGFGLYYNDCFNYQSIESYTKHTIKNASAANPEDSKYQAPGAAIQDCMILSSTKTDGGTIDETTAPPVVETTAAETTAAPVANDETTAPPANESKAEAPADDDATTAPDNDTETQPTDDGCGGFGVSVIATLLVALCGTGIVIRKKD